MGFDLLIHKMNMYSISTFRMHDLAVAANKLMEWSIEKRSIPPYLSTAANRLDLSKKELPLMLRVSDEMSMAIGLLHGNNPTKDKQYLMSNEDFISPETVLSTQSMLYNYSLLEEYEFIQFNKVLRAKILDVSTDKYSLKDFQNRGFDTLFEGVTQREQSSYERKSPEKRLLEWGKYGISPMPEEEATLYKKLSKRRNELTHESSPTPPTLEEAVGFFHVARLVAKGVATSFDDSSILSCDVPWGDFKPSK